MSGILITRELVERCNVATWGERARYSDTKSAQTICVLKAAGFIAPQNILDCSPERPRPTVDLQVEASRRGTMDLTVGAHTQARAVQDLSRGLFRSTGLSEHEADDHGQGEGVGE